MLQNFIVIYLNKNSEMKVLTCNRNPRLKIDVKNCKITQKRTSLFYSNNSCLTYYEKNNFKIKNIDVFSLTQIV